MPGSWGLALSNASQIAVLPLVIGKAEFYFVKRGLSLAYKYWEAPELPNPRWGMDARYELAKNHDIRQLGC